VFAPEGRIVNDCPEQMVPLFTVMVGVMSTVTLLTAPIKLIHPAEFVPVTEYELVTIGATVEEPFEKVYEAAPPGIIINVCPLQIVPLFTVMVGEGSTVIVLMAVFELTHPAVLVPVTE